MALYWRLNYYSGIGKIIMKDGIVMFEDDGTSTVPVTPEDVVKQKLIFLLQYHKGTNPLDTDYGTYLHTYTQRPNDKTLENSLRQEVISVINSYMPYVRVRSVTTSFNDGKLGIKISYKLDDDFEDEIDLEF
jgi:phage baseplate assembly protein W